MENASKALLIAGAILIVILLIAIGMLFYRNSKGVIDEAISQMSDLEITTFNGQFESYEGDNVKGTQLKSLLEKMSANASRNDSDESKRPSITGTVGAANLNMENPKSNDIDTLCSKIKSQKSYSVKFTKTLGLITSVEIKEK